MLLNKRFLIVFAGLIVVLTFSSCKKSSSDDSANKVDANVNNTLYNSDYLLSETKKILGDEVRFAAIGKFDSDTADAVVAGLEIENKNQFGIEFVLLEVKEGKLTRKYTTGLLNGSFTKSLTEKTQLPNYKHDLVYYNSQNYFVGVEEGEIFSYLIDFSSRDKFYAHLYYTPEIKTSLYMSSNIKKPAIKQFFNDKFKKEFASFKFTSKDRNLD